MFNTDPNHGQKGLIKTAKRIIYSINTQTRQIRRQPPITAPTQIYKKANAFIDPV